MSDATRNEGVLRRWARRKQAAKALPPAPVAPTALSDLPAEPPPDLPDLDTLDAASDYTAFLQAGVSAEVQRLALQRAWASSPAIAEFRGMAEYAWDFNAPEYGRLWALDDVAKLVRAVVDRVAEEPEAPAPPVAAQEAPVQDALAEPAPDELAGPPAELEAEPAKPLPRRHGSALPC